MASLTDRLQHVLAGYVGPALNGYSYLTSNADGTLFAVVSIGKSRDARIVDADLVVRVVGEHLIVERDLNSKPLVDALIQAGVPRDCIVLAYAGEPAPSAA